MTTAPSKISPHGHELWSGLLLCVTLLALVVSPVSSLCSDQNATGSVSGPFNATLRPSGKHRTYQLQFRSADEAFSALNLGPKSPLDNVTILIVFVDCLEEIECFNGSVINGSSVEISRCEVSLPLVSPIQSEEVVVMVGHCDDEGDKVTTVSLQLPGGELMTQRSFHH